MASRVKCTPLSVTDGASAASTGGDARVERGRIGAARLDQQSRGLRPQRVDIDRHALLGLDAFERGAVEQLHRVHRRGFERGHRPAGGLQIAEDDKGRRLVVRIVAAVR